MTRKTSPSRKRPKAKPRPKRSKATGVRIEQVKFDASDILLKSREIFIYEPIRPEVAQRVIRELRALNALKVADIKLWINSPGGCVASGFAIINIMRSIQSKVITIINSRAASMAAQISIAGDERLIVDNGTWMAHDMTAGGYDYSMKLEDRADYHKKLYRLLEQNMKKYTDLSTRELNRARAGELWLFAEDALEKGIVDKVIESDIKGKK